MKEYIKKELMQILEKERIKILCKGTTILKQLGRKRTNPVHVRENDKRSKRKWKAENPDHIKEIAKCHQEDKKLRIKNRSEKT